MAWDAEWYAEGYAEHASAALRYLAEHYPESAGSPWLYPHQDAAHEAAVSGDRDAYLEALRAYMRRGRAVALEIRERAA